MNHHHLGIQEWKCFTQEWQCSRQEWQCFLTDEPCQSKLEGQPVGVCRAPRFVTRLSCAVQEGSVGKNCIPDQYVKE